MKTVLTIAGSDSSGGAGIQADLKTMCALGVYGMSAITAITAQNTMGVAAIEKCSQELLAAQLDCVFTDIFPDAVKIGMVFSADLAEIIADKLKQYKAGNIVLDPVMVSTSGKALIEPDTVKVMTDRLFPVADVITPNIPEAESLIGMRIATPADMEQAAAKIADRFGVRAVLLKGGHSVSDANDVLYRNGKVRWFKQDRIDNPNTHGTGCTVSSAIASFLAKGSSLEESILLAKEYLTNALKAGLKLGSGSGPMMHNWSIVNESKNHME